MLLSLTHTHTNCAWVSAGASCGSCGRSLTSRYRTPSPSGSSFAFNSKSGESSSAEGAGTGTFTCYVGSPRPACFATHDLGTYYTLLYSTLLYSTHLNSTLLYSTLLYYALLYYAIRCYTLLYYNILCYTILCYTPLYCTILYCNNTTLCSYAIAIIMLHYTGHPICILLSHARVCAQYGTHERLLSLHIIIIY